MGGGGGVIRAAANVGIGGGLGAVATGIRQGGGLPNFRPADASSPVSSVLNSSTSPELAAVSTGDVQKPFWDVDEWVFAGGEEEVLPNSNSNSNSTGEAMPRMVFGSTPTMQEAEEATAELKDALDKVYLSSANSGGWVPTLVGRVPGLSVLTNSEHEETKPCVTSQTIITTAAPENALQAFKLLSESTAAQTVVASIACDQNVWNAVLGNPVLLEFLESQKKTGTRIEEMDDDSVADSNSQNDDSPSKFEYMPDFSLAGTGLAITLQNLKQKVLQMISSVSDILQNIFGPSISDHKAAAADGNAKFNAAEKTVGASLMGLAVMAIMVILLKRA